MTKKKEFAYEALQEAGSIVKYLQAVADGFESGVLTLSDKNGQVTLEPRGLIDFEVRITRKRDQTRLTLSLSWKPAAQEDGPEAGSVLITVGKQ